MRMCMAQGRVFVLVAVIVIFHTIPAQAADQNLHVMEGMLTSCGCQYFPGADPDWICEAIMSLRAPAPWYGPNPQASATVHVELTGEAIEQCGVIPLYITPHRARMLFWLKDLTFDYGHPVIGAPYLRRPIMVYYLTDLGPADPITGNPM